METVSIPEKDLMVVGKSSIALFVADISVSLNEKSIMWKWDGAEFAPGRWAAIWTKWIPDIKELIPPEPLSNYKIPYPEKLEIWDG